MLSPFGVTARGAPPVGLVDLNALLGALRGPPLSPARASVIRDAYALLQSRTTPAAGPTLADLLRFSHVGKADSRVAAGHMTAVEAAAEFGRQWPAFSRPSAVVDAASFEGFYADVSAMVAEEDAFIELVANTWHLPGQGSWRGKMGK